MLINVLVSLYRSQLVYSCILSQFCIPGMTVSRYKCNSKISTSSDNPFTDLYILSRKKNCDMSFRNEMNHSVSQYRISCPNKQYHHMSVFGLIWSPTYIHEL